MRSDDCFPVLVDALRRPVTSEHSWITPSAPPPRGALARTRVALFVRVSGGCVAGAVPHDVRLRTPRVAYGFRFPYATSGAVALPHPAWRLGTPRRLSPR